MRWPMHSLAPVFVSLVAALGTWLGCERAQTVEIVPVLPIDPVTGRAFELSALQEKLEFNRFQVVFQPLSTVEPASSRTLNVEFGHRLELSDLEDGTWRVEVSALSATEEKLFGQSGPFKVRRGSGGRVHLPLGESFAFNLMEWRSQGAAEAFRDLEDASGISFEDDEGRQLILVTGGRRGAEGKATAEAMLIDTGTFEVTFLDPMPQARAGHRALLVDQGTNPRVVFVGGDAGSPGVIIFDSMAREFRLIDLVSSCPGLESTDGAFMARATLGGVSTGQIIVPGKQQCIVNLLTGQAELSDELYDPAPGPAAFAAENSAGEVFILDGGTLYAERALERESCRNTEQSAESAAWSGLARSLDNPSLWPLSHDPTGRFLVVGNAEDRLAWQLIGVNSCSVDAVTEGVLGSGTRRTQAALINLPSIRFNIGDYLPQAAALLTGGRATSGRRLSDVLLFVDSKAPESSMHGAVWLPLGEESSRSPIRMKRERSGHMAVPVGERAVWILGGDESGFPEIFMLGRGKRLAGGEIDPGQYESSLTLRSIRLQGRKPGLRLVAVLDTRAEARLLRNKLAASLPPLLASKPLLNHVRSSQDISFLAVSQDLGIQDDRVWSAVKDDLIGSFCMRNSAYETPGMLYVPKLTGDDRVVRAIADLTPNLKPTYSVEGCSIRQPLRALFDALTNIDKAPELEEQEKLKRLGSAAGDQDVGNKPGTVDIPPEIGSDRARTDITVALFLMMADDCSSGLVDPRSTSVLDSEMLFSCSDPIYDEFFSLPPLPEETSQLAEHLKEAVNKPQNLSTIVLGNVAGEVLCRFTVEETTSSGDAPSTREFSDAYLVHPRRLLAAVHSLESLGVSTSAAHICTSALAKWSFDESLEYFLTTAVARRDNLLACVPEDYAVAGSAMAGDTETEVAAGSADVQKEEADLLAQSLAARCQFFMAPSVAADAAAGGTVHVVQTLFEPGKDFAIVSSSATNLGCAAEEKWAVEFSTKSLWQASGPGLVEAIESGADDWKQALQTVNAEANNVAILCVD